MLGSKILEEVESPINGKILVIKTLGLGTYIQAGNLTQSGGVVHEIWDRTLKKLRNKEIKNCLILGLGGGSAARLVQKYWPASPNRGGLQAKITGVDIDPVMVETGKKYLGLSGIEIVILDAEKYLLTISRQPLATKFDLILVDLYLGDKFPEKFEKDNFLLGVKKILSEGGVAVFNRLYYGEKRKEAEKFSEKLEKIFSKVERFFPEANLMFLCYNSSSK